MIDTGEHGVEHLTKDYTVPGWVLALVTLMTPLVVGAVGWGEMSARVAAIEDRVAHQSMFISDATKKIDESAEKLAARIAENETSRAARSDGFSDKLSDLGARVSALTAQMVFLNAQLAHDRDPSIPSPGGHR